MGIIRDTVKDLISQTATSPDQPADLADALSLILAAKAAHDVGHASAKAALAAEEAPRLEALRVSEVTRLLDQVLNPPKEDTKDTEPVKDAEPVKR